jgi:hypothetical protein
MEQMANDYNELSTSQNCVRFIDELCFERYFLLNQTKIAGMMDIIRSIIRIMEDAFEVYYGNNFKYLNAIYFDLEGLEVVEEKMTSASFSNILHTITLPYRVFNPFDMMLIDCVLMSYRRFTSGGYVTLSFVYLFFLRVANSSDLSS